MLHSILKENTTYLSHGPTHSVHAQGSPFCATDLLLQNLPYLASNLLKFCRHLPRFISPSLRLGFTFHLAAASKDGLHLSTLVGATLGAAIGANQPFGVRSIWHSFVFGNEDEEQT